jgi:hypothetical protein
MTPILLQILFLICNKTFLVWPNSNSSCKEMTNIKIKNCSFTNYDVVFLARLKGLKVWGEVLLAESPPMFRPLITLKMILLANRVTLLSLMSLLLSLMYSLLLLLLSRWNCRGWNCNCKNSDLSFYFSSNIVMPDYSKMCKHLIQPKSKNAASLIWFVLRL